MSPAFSSARQAATFALLLLGLIALPLLVSSSKLPPRSEIYSSIGWRCGPFPFLHHEIFDKKDDIDIAFVGSSHLWSGIDTPFVEKELTRKLGRKAVVVSLGWPWPG